MTRYLTSKLETNGGLDTETKKLQYWTTSNLTGSILDILLKYGVIDMDYLKRQRDPE